MISVILPLHRRVELTLLSVLAIGESLAGEPFEVIYIKGPEGTPDDSLLRGGNFSVVESATGDFGPMLNCGARAIHHDSDLLFFLAPGMVILQFPSSRFSTLCSESPFSILGYSTSKLINPVSKRVQPFPSWFSLLTTREAFESIGGFNEYLPQVGGDFFYCLECRNNGGNLRGVSNGHHMFGEYSLCSERVMSVHQELFFKRLPMLMKAKGLRGDPLLDWPGLSAKEKC